MTDVRVRASEHLLNAMGECAYCGQIPSTKRCHGWRPATRSDLIAALLPGNSPGARDAVEMMVNALTRAGLEGLEPYLPKVEEGDNQ